MLLTGLLTLYLRHESLNVHSGIRSAIHVEHAVASTVSATGVSGASAPRKQLEEPWGSHHMYVKSGPLAPCPKQFAPGSWASTSMGQWTLPLTLEAQQEIYANQNPEDCRQGTPHGGLGTCLQAKAARTLCAARPEVQGQK